MVSVLVPPGDSATDRVLPVVDRAVILTATLGSIRLFLAPGPTWLTASLAVGIALTLGLAIAGLRGRAPWRRYAYPPLILYAAAVAVVRMGPFGGPGALIVVGTITVAALFRTRALTLAFITVALAAFGVHAAMAVGVWGAPSGETVVFDQPRLWLRVTVFLGMFATVAMLVIRRVTAALEEALGAAADAYRTETATLAELEASRRKLDELEQIELVGRLAGGVAHDVNNALTAILAASEVVADDLTSASQQQRLAELEAASQHAADLVRDLLWIGRKFPPTTEEARVADTLATCRRRLARMARGLDLAVDVAPGLRVGIAPERLEQILFWLIIRAHRAGAGALALVATRDGGEVAITLSGAPREVPSTASIAVPTKVMRAELTTSAAQDQVAQAGGRLALTESDDELRIEVRLPAALRERSTGQLVVGVTALVVDDEPLVLSRLARLVARRGYRVMTASSLAEAWPLLDQHPDLLLTDLQLGDGRGEDLAIASYERTPARPIIVCSGFGADDALRERLRGALLTFLPKPFTREELERAIPLAREAG